MNNHNNAILYKNVIRLERRVTQLEYALNELRNFIQTDGGGIPDSRDFPVLSIRFNNESEQNGFNAWNAVTSIENTIVVVGSLIGYYNYGNIDESGNISWNITDYYLGTNIWHSICSNNIKSVVAVGINSNSKEGQYMLGTLDDKNKLSWVDSGQLGEKTEWSNICYIDNDKLVALGNNNCIIGTINASYDHISWSDTISIGGDKTWFSITYIGNNKVMIAGFKFMDSGYYMIGNIETDNSITWSEPISTNCLVLWSSVVYDKKGHVLLSGYYGNTGYTILGTITSSDSTISITWSELNEFSNFKPTNTIYTKTNIFICSGTDSSSNGKYIIGTRHNDIMSWSNPIELGTEEFNSLCITANNHVIMVGGNTKGYYVIGNPVYE